MKYRTKDGDMLDALCVAQYGAREGAVEAVLNANPGLASIGPVLPSGVVISLPELASVSDAPSVRLWD